MTPKKIHKLLYLDSLLIMIISVIQLDSIFLWIPERKDEDSQIVGVRF